MIAKTCTLVGCERKHRCKGLCAVHYERLRKHGTTADPAPRPSACTVTECLSPVVGRGMCHKHYYRWKRHGTTADPQERTDIGYTGAHWRVRSAKGPATDRACVDCGKPAQEWSYAGGDPAELVDPAGRPYSLDPATYEARCRRCHRLHDSPRRPTCSIAGCNNLNKAKGMCNKHYQAQRAHLVRLATAEEVAG